MIILNYIVLLIFPNFKQFKTRFIALINNVLIFNFLFRFININPLNYLKLYLDFLFSTISTIQER